MAVHHTLFRKLSHEYFPALRDYSYERKGDAAAAIFKDRRKRKMQNSKKRN